MTMEEKRNFDAVDEDATSFEPGSVISSSGGCGQDTQRGLQLGGEQWKSWESHREHRSVAGDRG